MALDSQHALNLLIERGVLSKEVNLRELAAVSAELQKLANPGDLAGWVLINKEYVLVGKVADKGETLVGR